MLAKPVIVLEFNELTPAVMKNFIEQKHLPNFAKLQAESRCYVTDAGEKPPNLEPWIQWITVHSGLAFSQHGVFNLGDSKKAPGEAIWDVASNHDMRVWICGSMNAYYGERTKGWVLPDPWSVHVRPNTSELNPYFDFVRSQVIDYTRTDGRIGVGTAYKFLAFMIRHGLRLSTVLAIMSQLIRERFAAVRWQRATILDRLQFDLFRYVYRKQKPQLSTFFINSTAHFQHCYWRNMDPSPFSLKPTPSDQNAHAGAVLHGYKAMDRIVGEVMAMAGDNATIVFATALGQQPCLTYEASGGKSFYKPNDFSTWLRAVGIEPSTCVVEPVMSEQFHLRFATPQAAADAAEILNQSTVNDQQAFGINVDGNSIMVGCCIFNELPPDSMLTTKAGAHRFADLLYFVDTVKSGMHHPEGLLWVRVPGEKPNQQSQTVPLVDVAPTILALLGLPAPKNTAGRSLLT